MAAPWLNPEWRPSPFTRATVVLVHGAVVNGEEMFPLGHRLRQLGYQTRLFRYQSMLRSLDHNVRSLSEFLRETESDVVHVVGHSMGGVVARLAFERAPDPRPGRIVAIGSPLLSCWVGNRFHRLHPRWGRYLIGQTVYDHIKRPSDPVWHGTRDFGVLAGTYPFGIGAIFQSHPRPSDGVVLLEETRLQGIRDHLSYRLNHFGMLFSKRCCAQIARFLAYGEFLPAPGLPADQPGVLEVHGKMEQV
jgi:pimeloyl-ACP methyl ester carboxylesterase